MKFVNVYTLHFCRGPVYHAIELSSSVTLCLSMSLSTKSICVGASLLLYNTLYLSSPCVWEHVVCMVVTVMSLSSTPVTTSHEAQTGVTTHCLNKPHRLSFILTSRSRGEFLLFQSKELRFISNQFFCIVSPEKCLTNLENDQFPVNKW